MKKNKLKTNKKIGIGLSILFLANLFTISSIQANSENSTITQACLDNCETSAPVAEAKITSPEFDTTTTSNKIDISLDLKKNSGFDGNIRKLELELYVSNMDAFSGVTDITNKYNKQIVAKVNVYQLLNTDMLSISLKDIPMLFSGKNYISCNLLSVSDDSIPFANTSCRLLGNTSKNLDHIVTYTGTTNDIPVFRYWSDVYQSHFYVSNLAEKKEVDKNPEWKFEGVAYYAGRYQTNAMECYTEGQKLVHRFWSNVYKSHFYTINEAEKNEIIAKYPTDTWNYEGPSFCAYPKKAENTTAVYRFWSTEYGNHFFTSNAAERDYVIDNYPDTTWSYEGEAYYVMN